MTKIYVLKSIYTADESQEVVDLISLSRQKIRDELSIVLFNFLDAYTKSTRFCSELFVGEIGVDVWENEEIIQEETVETFDVQSGKIISQTDPITEKDLLDWFDKKVK